MPDVRPCPFCGSHNVDIADHRFGYVVMCQGCGAYGPDNLSRDKAIAAWNKRADPGEQ